jgi:hypothetical protein
LQAAVTIVINSFLAWRWLHERLTPYDVISTSLIGAGTIVSVVFGAAAPADVSYDVAIIMGLLQRDVVYISAAAMAAGFLACLAYLRFARGASKLRCFLYALCAGLFSGTTGWLTKASVSCVTSMVRSGSTTDLATVPFWIFLFGLPASLVCQLFWLNKGLREFDSMLMIPPYQSCIVAFGNALGFLWWNEAAGVSASTMSLFAVGVSMSISGIAVLGFKPKRLAESVGTDAGEVTTCEDMQTGSLQTGAAHVRISRCELDPEDLAGPVHRQSSASEMTLVAAMLGTTVDVPVPTRRLSALSSTSSRVQLRGLLPPSASQLSLAEEQLPFLRAGPHTGHSTSRGATIADGGITPSTRSRAGSGLSCPLVSHTGGYESTSGRNTLVAPTVVVPSKAVAADAVHPLP